APWRHADDVRAELRELGKHEPAHALANGCQQHDGGDADPDAQRRQRCPQAMRANGAGGQADEIGKAHHSRLCLQRLTVIARSERSFDTIPGELGTPPRGAPALDGSMSGAAPTLTSFLRALR